jgi:hypothetical protein
MLLLLLLHATLRWEAWQQLNPSLAEFLKLQKTQTESNTHNSRFLRGGKKKFNPNCFLREQQISHTHEEEEEEETKTNKKLAQTFLLQQQQQQQLVNKGTQQQTNNLKILQRPKIVYKIKKISSPKSFLKKIISFQVLVKWVWWISHVKKLHSNKST